jgi:CheY-like chemotaxis protein
LFVEHVHLSRISGDKMKVILVVDDDEDVLEITAEVLRASGYHVVTAAHAQAGLDLLASVHVDAILTDVIMPGMNGFHFARLAREMRPEVRVMCITGYSRVPDEPDHCDKVLFKPWQPKALTYEVNRLVRGSET